VAIREVVSLCFNFLNNLNIDFIVILKSYFVIYFLNLKPNGESFMKINFKNLIGLFLISAKIFIVINIGIQLPREL